MVNVVTNQINLKIHLGPATARKPVENLPKTGFSGFQIESLTSHLSNALNKLVYQIGTTLV